ncbi:sulfite exporter TauE/SafE family protein [Sphingomonas ginkgonis]|uniref:Probable membrane transporter protein n=1 Tax=Sphingomonas ginkgonis TaxID=2315330 RepID=A0A3R9YN34_9SPHN|nr:sulfite exporter TauE/SafE family protein [Sphingomonas ginkgonis]RST31576.1 sulfite exporter TauE/SafE family protein [Sphingomonas ginkgonis]
MSDFNPLYSLAGFLVGALVGLTGVGGGSLMTPLLVLLFGFHPATAVGTDLLYASVTKSVGTAVHGRRKTVDWRLVGLLASGSVPASLVTLLALSRYGKLDSHFSALLGYTLGTALVLTGIAVLFQLRIVRWARPAFERADERQIAMLTVALGVVLGVLVSLTSVGAGALGVTALLILYPHLPVARIAGSDIAHAVPLTLIAGLGHVWLGDVDFSLMLNLLSGSIPGIILGSLFGSRSPDHVLRPILAVTLLIVGGRLLLA